MLKMICLDLEGILVPEIWISFSEATGIKELRLTTRDISDYNVLMRRRIAILKEHNLTLEDIQKVIATMDPLEGAIEFLDGLRSNTQAIILSDTFVEFAKPLMKKLKWPTLFCNFLIVDKNGMIQDYSLRQEDGKRHAVEALSRLEYHVTAVGDSYNDINMLKVADRGILFRPPENVRKEYPAFPAVTTYSELARELDGILDQ